MYFKEKVYEVYYVTECENLYLDSLKCLVCSMCSRYTYLIER